MHARQNGATKAAHSRPLLSRLLRGRRNDVRGQRQGNRRHPALPSSKPPRYLVKCVPWLRWWWVAGGGRRREWCVGEVSEGERERKVGMNDKSASARRIFFPLVICCSILFSLLTPLRASLRFLHRPRSPLAHSRFLLPLSATPSYFPSQPTSSVSTARPPCLGGTRTVFSPFSTVFFLSAFFTMPVDPTAKPISLAAMTARGNTATLPTEGPFARVRAAAGTEPTPTTTNAAAPTPAPAPAPAQQPVSPDLPAISVNGLTFCYPDLGTGERGRERRRAVPAILCAKKKKKTSARAGRRGRPSTFLPHALSPPLLRPTHRIHVQTAAPSPACPPSSRTSTSNSRAGRAASFWAPTGRGRRRS